MSTIRELNQKFDTLVFEYLKSTCSSPVAAQLFQQDRKLEVVDTGGITIEGLYFSQLLKSEEGLECKGIDYSVKVEQNNDWEKPEGERGTTTIPNLPPEVIGTLMNYFSIKDRFSLRLINKNWNQISSKNLRRYYNIPIKIRGQHDVDRFVNSFVSRIQGSINPFATYCVSLNGSDVLPVFEAIGQDTGALIVEAPCGTSGSQLSQIFKHTSFVQKLCICGKISIKDTDFADSKLANLDLLRLIPNTMDQIQHWSFNPFYPSAQEYRWHWHNQVMDHKNLSNWLTLAPSLQRLHCNYIVQVESANDFAQMIYSHGSLDTILLDCISITSPAAGPFHELVTSSLSCHEDDTTLKPEVLRLLNLTILDYVTSELEDAVSQLTHSLAASLQNLTFTLKCGNVSVSNLPKLTNLKIRLQSSPYVPNPIQAKSIPALKCLTLAGWVATSLAHNPFRDDVFSTVEDLCLIMPNQYHEFINNGNTSWQSMFPRLTSLRVMGCPSEKSLNKINDSFANILHLSLILDYGTPVGNCGREVVVPLPYFGVQEIIENGQITWKWIFSNLRKLKTLELQFLGRYGSIVTDLAHLTLMKIMKPLEILSFNRGFYHTGNQNVGNFNPISLYDEVKYKEELSLLFSLQELHYHTNLKLAKLEQIKTFN